VISGDDSHGITILKKYLSTHFHMKDVGHLRYFFWDRGFHSPHGLSPSQRKYLTDLLTESGMLGS